MLIYNVVVIALRVCLMLCRPTCIHQLNHVLLLAFFAPGVVYSPTFLSMSQSCFNRLAFNGKMRKYQISTALCSTIVCFCNRCRLYAHLITL